VLLAHVQRGLLQHPWNEANLVGEISREERGGGAADVVKPHGFSELLLSARADDIVDATSGQRASLI